MPTNGRPNMPKFHTLRVKEVRRETPECVSISFEVPEELRSEFAFLPGQHLTLKTEIDGEEVRRNYSICTSPQEGELRVAVKRLEGGRFSTFANEKLRPSATLEVMTPSGSFHTPLSPEQRKHYVAFAAGSGITPIISILKAALHTEPHSRFTLFYCNRTKESTIFREELEALKNRFLDRFSLYFLFTREKPGIELFHGRIDAEKLKALSEKLLDLEDVDEVFVCGPEPMIRAVRETLPTLGFPERHIHFELFTSPSGPLLPRVEDTARKRPPVLAQVEITLDGNRYDLELTSNGESLLEAGLRIGLDLPFACKGGVCCTCKAKLLEGQVDMDVNWGLEPDELQAGYILTCQSHPKTERIRLSYDI